MTKIEDFRQFLADMDDLNGRLESLAKEASAALADRAALLRCGKTIGPTIAAVDQMLANIRVDYRPPVDTDADAESQDGGLAGDVRTEDGGGEVMANRPFGCADAPIGDGDQDAPQTAAPRDDASIAVPSGDDEAYF